MPGKVKYNQLTDFEKQKYLGEFYTMVTSLKTREEVKNFFKDLLTLSEVVMISRRIQIAGLLLEGLSYDEIRKRLKVGFSTVNQVERWLNNGFGGYRKTILEFKKNQRGRAKDDIPEVPYSKNWVKKKYPLHFLLANIAAKSK
jgi:TrpR-related protein YerC/YecD